MADEAKQLFEEHGLDPEATLAWAKEKAARLLEESGGGDLEGLLEGLDAEPPPRRERPARRARPPVEEQPAAAAESDADEPSVARPLPPLPNEAAAEAAAEAEEELEELDVEELEELDVDELELIEEVDEDESDYSDAPVRTGDTAPHAVVTEAIVDEDEDGEDDDDIDLTGMGDDVDEALLSDDSIPIDLDDD